MPQKCCFTEVWNATNTIFIILLDNSKCTPSFLRSLCKLEVIVPDQGIFLRECTYGRQNTEAPEQSPTVSHKWRNRSGAKLSLSLTTAIFDFFTSIFNCIFPWICYQPFFLSICIVIAVWQFRSIQTYAHCLFWQMQFYAVPWPTLVCFEKKNDYACARNIAGHYQKLLLCDNDPRWHWCKMKIISLDWITLLHRLLIVFKSLN